ncbi:MspA family porin [Nocardia nova]|nr:MspA family porin [Nocardia nova]MBF6149579.1 MspA family porin [Nocardia nova]
MSVTNAPPTREALSLPGSGHGLIGLTERAELLNGQLRCGSTEAGGFRVDCDCLVPERRSFGGRFIRHRTGVSSHPVGTSSSLGATESNCHRDPAVARTASCGTPVMTGTREPSLIRGCPPHPCLGRYPRRHAGESDWIEVATLARISPMWAGTLTDKSRQTVTDDGWTLMVTKSGENLDRWPSLANSPVSREGFVSVKAVGELTGHGGHRPTSGTVTVGYQIGCAVDVFSGVVHRDHYPRHQTPDGRPSIDHRPVGQGQRLCGTDQPALVRHRGDLHADRRQQHHRLR